MRLLLAQLLKVPVQRLRSRLRPSDAQRGAGTRRGSRSYRFLALLGAICCVSITLNSLASLVRAQDTTELQQQENQLIQEFVLPQAPSEPPIYYPEPAAVPAPEPSFSEPAPEAIEPAPAPAPVAEEPPVEEPAPAPARPAPTPAQERAVERPRTATRKPAGPTSQYVIEFDRIPVVGNRLRLQGVHPETRIGFTRPQNWEVKDAKLRLRYQHSPSLLADKSRLVVRVNDRSIGSLPLDRQNAQIGEALFEFPGSLVQDYNEISLLAEQQSSETCSNPADPTLWTEVLPDSKVELNYRPQPVALNFSSYPRPFLDALSLDENRLSYLRPKTYSAEWLTAAARFQTASARQLDYRPLKTQLVKDITPLQWNDRLIVIGTPAEQPLLGSLPSLPFPIKNGKILDGEGNPVPEEVGVLMMTVLRGKGTPVLIATGNSSAAVGQAVQFLVQSRDQQLGTGQALTVDQVSAAPSPDPRNWSGYLPTQDQFQLKDLTLTNRQPFQDVTVRGTNAPAINIPFRALPDDRFLRGSTMNLRYSYSPQVDPGTSAVEIKLDGVTVAAKRLTSTSGEKQTFRLNLPENLIKPNSTLGVSFVMNPKAIGVCGLETDRQLWGTVHGDTGFKLVRDTLVKLPDLKLLQTGYPFTAPQDLSATAVTIPDSPTDLEVETLLALGERLGRLSQADSVKYQVYTGELPPEVRNQQHVIGIGDRERFPIVEAFQPDQGFGLAASFTRFWAGSEARALPDQQGILKGAISPWNRDRSLLAVTAQTDVGLKEAQMLLKQDSLFSQVRGDTVMISRNQPNPSPFDASGYDLQFLQETPPQRIQHSNSFNQLVLYLQDYWFFVLIGILFTAILLYSLSQVFLNRLSDPEDAS